MEILVIPDIHIGDKYLSLKHIHAIRQAIAAATEREARIVILGDLFEMTDISDEAEIVAGCKHFQDCLAAYKKATRMAVIITLGNHDRYLNHEHLAAFFPGIPFELHKDWWLKDGVLLHHGHLADVAKKHILDHLDRNPDKSLAGIKRFIDSDKAYRLDRRNYHARNMVDLGALMRFAEERVWLPIAQQLKWYDNYYSASLGQVNTILRRRFQAEKPWLLPDDRRQLPAELGFNEALADNDSESLWAIGQGHMHNPFASSFLTRQGRRPIIFNAGMIYSAHRDPSCVWINTKNSRAKTCRLFTYTNGNWRLYSTLEHGRSAQPYLTQPAQVVLTGN